MYADGSGVDNTQLTPNRAQPVWRDLRDLPASQNVLDWEAKLEAVVADIVARQTCPFV